MNVDFADVRTVMPEMGYAMMGSGVASGEDRAEEAAEMAIFSAAEDIDSVRRARRVGQHYGGLTCVWTSLKPSVTPFARLRRITPPWLSVPLDPDSNDEPCVTVAATGIGMDKRPEITWSPINNSGAAAGVDRYQQHGMAPLTQEQKNGRKSG